MFYGRITLEKSISVGVNNKTGVWGRSLQPPETNWGLRVEPPTLREFCSFFFAKNTHF